MEKDPSAGAAQEYEYLPPRSTSTPLWHVPALSRPGALQRRSSSRQLDTGVQPRHDEPVVRYAVTQSAWACMKGRKSVVACAVSLLRTTGCREPQGKPLCACMQRERALAVDLLSCWRFIPLSSTRSCMHALHCIHLLLILDRTVFPIQPRANPKKLRCLPPVTSVCCVCHGKDVAARRSSRNFRGCLPRAFTVYKRGL